MKKFYVMLILPPFLPPPFSSSSPFFSHPLKVKGTGVVCLRRQSNRDGIRNNENRSEPAGS